MESIEVKKIHEDKRGEIWQLMILGKEHIIILTKKGCKRGGDYHKSVQHDVILEGAIKFVTPKYTIVLGEGEKIMTPKGIPHYFESLGDSVVLEWLEGKFEKKYYKPFRKLIDV